MKPVFPYLTYFLHAASVSLFNILLCLESEKVNVKQKMYIE